ncbi:MAG: ArnT family glycosyltransferase [Chloroflexota bacterium]
MDEPIFVRAAVDMLHRHSLDPEWFGNPGSTIIYPIAALAELWYQMAKHLPPFAHEMPGIRRELIVDPMPFYVIGRLVSVAYGVGSIAATWLLGRRILGGAGGVLAALVLAASPIAVAYGQLVRTDMAGTFFALIAIWLAVRAMASDRRRDWALSAIAIGLAISSRYFFASLLVPYGAAAWLWYRSGSRSATPGDRRRTLIVPAVALVLTPITFAITSPFVLLDLPRAIADIRFEARGVHPGADGLTPIGNLAWYIGEVLPSTVGPALLLLAVFGAVVVARRDARAATVLAAFSISYLVAVSASPLHWNRYVIPLIPVIGICVSACALAVGDAVARGIAGWQHRSRLTSDPAGTDARTDKRLRPLGVGIACAIMLFLLVPSLAGIAAADRVRAAPSTRVLATRWIADNLPSNARIAEEMYTAYLEGTDYELLRVFSLADRSLDAYRADGYSFVIRSSAMADRFQDRERYPKESDFYRSLDTNASLLASFHPDPEHSGPVISIYDIRER